MMQARSLSRLLLRRPACQFVPPPSPIARPLIPSYVRRFAAPSQETPVSTTAPAEPSSIPVSTFNTPFAPPPERKQETFAMKTYKPRTPGLRHLRRPINEHLWKGRPFLPLTFAKKGQALGGRNHTGRITVRHRGGGHKRRIRTVDFFRMAPGKHIVDRIEGDPGRSAHLALVTNEATGRKSYILAAEGMREGDAVQSYRSGIPDDLLASMGGVIDPGMLAAKTAWRGNCLPLHMIPIGTVIYAVGSAASGKAVFCRSAGTYATVVAKDEKHGCMILRLQSGEIRRIKKDAAATIGVASNPTWQHRQLGKAGRKRWMGIRPTVRGLAMNAFEHPHGGGRGKSKSRTHPVSPWGTPAKSGYKTRNVNKPNRWVVTPRVRNNGKRRKVK